MSNTNMELSAIEQRVDDFKAKYETALMNEQQKVRDAADNRDEKAYLFAAELALLAIDLNVNNGNTTLIEFLSKRGQKFASDGENKFGPLVKAVCAVREDGKWVFGPKQRSFDKYANVTRHLVDEFAAGRLTADRDVIVNYIKDFDHSTYGRKLRGIEAQDRAVNPSASLVLRQKEAIDYGRDAQVLARLDNIFGANDNDVVKLQCRVVDGKLEVLKGDVFEGALDALHYLVGNPLRIAANGKKRK